MANGDYICPICTNQDDIAWSGLIADRVELCVEHKTDLAIQDAINNGKVLTFDDQKHDMAQRLLQAGQPPIGEILEQAKAIAQSFRDALAETAVDQVRPSPVVESVTTAHKLAEKHQRPIQFDDGDNNGSIYPIGQTPPLSGEF